MNIDKMMAAGWKPSYTKSLEIHHWQLDLIPGLCALVYFTRDDSVYSHSLAMVCLTKHNPDPNVGHWTERRWPCIWGLNEDLDPQIINTVVPDLAASLRKLLKSGRWTYPRIRLLGTKIIKQSGIIPESDE